MLEDPPDTMPGGSYDPAAVGIMREECLRRPTAEFFKGRYQRASFADFGARFPARPLARITSLPAGEHSDVVFVDGGDERDPGGSSGFHVLWTGRDPDNAPVKELLEAGGAILTYVLLSSPYAPRDGQEPVVVRGHAGGIIQRRWWLGCVRVDNWEIDWAAPAGQGRYVYTRVSLSSARFTRAQALALCEAMENWPR